MDVDQSFNGHGYKFLGALIHRPRHFIAVVRGTNDRFYVCSDKSVTQITEKFKPATFSFEWKDNKLTSFYKQRSGGRSILR